VSYRPNQSAAIDQAPSVNASDVDALIC